MDENKTKAATAGDGQQRSSNSNRNRNRKRNRNNAVKSSARDVMTGRTSQAAQVGDGVSETAAQRNALNDIAWYSRYPVLLDAASRFQFLNRPGDTLGGPGGINMTGGSDGNNWWREIPGIMRIEYQAALGTSKDNSSPASICAKGIYDKIRDAYSGTLAAQPADIFMYIMHIDQFQAYIAWLKRIYGILAYYTPFNYMVPMQLFKAMFPSTANVQDSWFFNWVSHKNDLYNYINQLVYMCNKYVVPSSMAVFDRHRWMNENVYRDTDSVLSQLYVFTPVGFWCVDGVDVENGTECNLIKFTASNISSVDAAFEYGRNMYNALADWGDAKTINGYIMRAFDGDFHVPCELMPIDYSVSAVYSFEVLLQIHNIRSFPEYIETKWEQDPATQAVIVTPSGVNSNLTDFYIDIPMDIPDQASVTIATRLHPVITGSDMASYEMHCGTEIVKSLWVSYRQNSTTRIDDTSFQNISRLFMINNLTDAVSRRVYISKALQIIVNHSAFFMAPPLEMHYKESGTGSSEANEFNSPIGEITNPAVVNEITMARLHLVCQQSEFNIYNARAL